MSCRKSRLKGTTAWRLIQAVVANLWAACRRGRDASRARRTPPPAPPTACRSWWWSTSCPSPPPAARAESSWRGTCSHSNTCIRNCLSQPQLSQNTMLTCILYKFTSIYRYLNIRLKSWLQSLQNIIDDPSSEYLYIVSEYAKWLNWHWGWVCLQLCS